VNHAGSGEDILVGFGQSSNHGGAGSDWLFAKDQAEVHGGGANDILVGVQQAELDGEDGDDWIFHFGNGVADGGAGDDVLVSIGGQREGDNIPTLRGGAGDDWLISINNDFSILVGGEGEDVLVSTGGETHMWGGDGTGAPDGEEDWFVVSNGAFVRDAGYEDKAFWDGFRLTGGMQMSWMESGWAYSMPVATAFMGMPGIFGNLIAATLLQVTVIPPMNFRYGMSESGQLIIQHARGRGGQAVIEDYDLDLETGAATGGVVVFRQEIGKSSLAEFRNYIELSIRAGFAGGYTGTDPLVLDLDGDGLDLTRRERGDVHFDLGGEGFARHTAWVGASDALLVRDINGNGRIDDISELFGNATISGFTELAALDSNADGVIDAGDAGFDTLQIWRDLDQNGESDAGELQTLTEAGIASISLSTGDPDVTDVNGNTIREVAGFTRSDGTTSTIADVLLDNDPTNTRYLGDTSVSAAAAALPALKGFGRVTDLRVAMTDDAALLAQVTAFADLPVGTSWADLRADAEAILYRWAGVDGVTADAMGTDFDTRKLAFLETYFGLELTPRDAAGVPIGNNLAELVESWDAALDKATARLAVQGPLAAQFAGVSYSEGRDRLQAEGPAALADAFSSALAQLPTDATAAQQAWDALWGPLLRHVTEAMRRADGIDVRHDYIVQGLVTALETTPSALDLATLAAGIGIADLRIGDAGATTLSRAGASGSIVYVADGSDQVFNGGTGQDVYVFGADFGQNVINDAEGRQSGDRIRLAMQNPDDVEITRDGIDLVISVIGTNDRITVTGHFETPLVSLSGMPISPDRAIEEIQFADGTVFESGDIAAAVGLGTDGDDVIMGTGKADEIEGLLGDDLLMGGDNGDIYFYARGDGNDTIHDIMTNPLLNAPDSMIFLDGIRAGDVTFSRDGDSDDLVISFAWTGDSITITDQFEYSSLGYGKFALNSRIEHFFFRDGPVYSWQEVQQMVIAGQTTDGDDEIFGFGTDDVFEASSGNDVIRGMDGGDTYHFGHGSDHDTIIEGSRFPETFISGLVDTDWGSNDKVVFGSGITVDDVTFARLGEEPDLQITLAGSETDSLTIKGQFDGVKLDLFNLLGIAWFDRIEEFHFEDGTVLDWEDVMSIVTTGTDGDDAIYGALYPDFIDGGAGNDYLSGGDDGDTYVFGRGYGNDVIDDKRTNVLVTAPDRVLFGPDIAVEDISFTRDGTSTDLLITIDGTDDLLRIKDQYRVTETGPFGAHAFNRIEIFEWEDGTISHWRDLRQEIIDAARTDGDDLIMGTHFDDVLDGGPGDDILRGDDGNDTYIFGFGYGHDRIIDGRNNILSGRQDKVVFQQGVTPDDLSFSRPLDSHDLVITLSDGSSLTIEKNFDIVFGIGQYEFNRIEEYHFEGLPDATMSIWDIQDILLTSTDGDDVLEGFEGDDVLAGGAGNDLLMGRNGDDTYMFGIGDGQDVIRDDETNILAGDKGDKVVFGPGIAPEDIEVLRIADDHDSLMLRIAGTDDTLTLWGQNRYSTINYRRYEIEHFHFEDGTQWTSRDVWRQYFEDARSDDGVTIRGFWTSDRIEGGAGNDVLIGGDGADTYLWGVGSGNDRIEESIRFVNYRSDDTIIFKGDLTIDDLDIARIGDDLVFTAQASGETLTVADHFRSAHQHFAVENFRFESGGVFTQQEIEDRVMTGTDADDTIIATAHADRIEGRGGDDSLTGDTGSDTYIYNPGDGNDTIIEAPDRHTRDTLVFGAGINAADVSFAPASSGSHDIVLTIAHDGATITLVNQLGTHGRGIEQIVFGDGETWLRTQIAQAAGVALNLVTGDDSGQTLNGTGGDDILEGGAGDDLLRGGSGYDIYVWGAGNGNDTISEIGGRRDIDTVQFTGLASSDVSITRTGADLFVTINATGEFLTIVDQFRSTRYAVERFEFTDTVWDHFEIARAAAQTGTTGDDTLAGTGYQDMLIGGQGDDFLEGGNGDDIYVYARGDGHDTIEEDHNDGRRDVLFLEDILPDAITLARNGIDVTLEIAPSAPGAGDAGSVTLIRQLNDYHYRGVERIEFADGTVWRQEDLREMLIAQASSDGDDTIIGFNTNDTLRGGTGDDFLDGGKGNDTYVYARGDGYDTIEEMQVAGRYDVLVFEDVLPDEITLVRNGIDVTLEIAPSAPGVGDAGSVTLIRQLNDYYYRGVERIEFADGTIWRQEDLREMVLAQAVTDGDDTITGFNADDVIRGGQGDDVLTGGKGDDTFIYARGDGHDTITEVLAGGRDDRLILEDILAHEIIVTREGDDAILNIAASADGDGSDAGSVRLVAQFDNEHQRGVESIVFADETIWYTGQLRANYLENATTDGDDEIFGFNDRDDTIIGGAGDDILHGGSGNDTLHGGEGNDRLEAGTGNNDLFGGPGDDMLVSNRGTNSFDGGAGNDTVDYSYSSASWEFNLDAEYARTGSVTETLVSIENVIGGSGDEIFYGNAADNIFSGGRGSDSYHFALGDGDDVIRENGRSNETDRLTLVELAPDAVELYQPFESEDLVVRILASGETMTVERHFEGTSRGIELIDFADGTSWNRADIKAMTAMAGTAGVDALVGTRAADLLDGGPGDDVLRGRLGSDTYIHAAGYGNDTIIETAGLNDTDVVRLVDLTRADVALSRDGLDLHVAILATGETLTVQEHFRSTQYGIEEIHFSDGEIMDRLMILEDANTLGGTGGDDTITGTSMRDWIRGGPGDDILDGRSGNDTYLYARGDGHDTITDGIHNGNDDRLIFEDINPDAITIMRDGTDITLDLAESAPGAGDAGSVHLGSQFNIYFGRGVETIIFADGTSWSQQDVRNMMALEGGGFATHLGFAGDDVIFGRAGSDDYIIGGAGDDTLHAVGGDNVIDGGTGDDVLHAGTGVDSFVFRAGDGVNDIIDFDTIQDRIVLDGVDLTDISFYQYSNGAQIFLADGTDFFFQDLTGASLGDFTFIDMDGNALVLPEPEPTNGLITGTDGDDSLVGSSSQGNHIIGGDGDDFLHGEGGDNLLDGGTGNDFMRSGSGQDTFVFRLGDGQDVLENFDITQDRIALDGLAIADLSLNVYSGGSQLIAADGTEFWLIGVTGVVPGDFSFIDMAGNALIPEPEPEPEAEPGLISGSQDDEDLIGSSAQDNRITGDAGNDFLDGVGGDNFLDGGAGNDFMASGTGQDTFVFRLGDGQDVIQDFDITQDRIALDGLAISELSLNGSTGGMQLVASDGTEFWLIGLADLALGDLSFVDMDGNALIHEPLAEPEPGPEPETGPEGEPEPVLGAITGTQDDDVLIGSAGQDNHIIGGEGDDFLDGVDGNNLLDGGTGDDFMASSAGQDSFVFRLGDGQDVIEDFDITQDRIALDGLSPIALEVVGHTGGTQLVAADGTEFWLIDVTGIERSDLSFVDMNGQSIDIAFSDVIIEGSPGNDELFGAIDENNHIIGGAGDDILHAVGGENILDGGAGDDALHSGTGTDTFVFRAGDGINNVIGFDLAQDRIALDGVARADISFYEYWNGAQIYLADGTDFFFEDLTGVTMDDFSFIDMDGNPIDASEPLTVLQGTTGDDTLVGSATRNNHIIGDAGDDFLDGVDGDNILDGGTGSDFMASGAGADTFVFRLGDGQDVIEDFDLMQDDIALDGLDEEDLTLTDHGSGSALVAADGTEFWFIGLTGANRTDLSFVNYDQIA